MDEHEKNGSAFIGLLIVSVPVLLLISLLRCCCKRTTIDINSKKVSCSRLRGCAQQNCVFLQHSCSEVFAEADRNYCCTLCRTSGGAKHGVKCESSVATKGTQKNLVSVKVPKIIAPCTDVNSRTVAPQVPKTSKASPNSKFGIQNPEMENQKVVDTKKMPKPVSPLDDDDLYPAAASPVKDVPIPTKSAPPPVRFPKKKGRPNRP
jgi:hypothetical protein